MILLEGLLNLEHSYIYGIQNTSIRIFSTFAMKYQLVILGKGCVQKSLMYTYLKYIHPSNIANLKLVGMFKWLGTCVYLWSLMCKQAEFEITWITSWYTSSMSSHRWLSYRILPLRDSPISSLFTNDDSRHQMETIIEVSSSLPHRRRLSHNGTCSIFYASTNTIRVFEKKDDSYISIFNLNAIAVYPWW